MLDTSPISAIRISLASPEQIRSWSSGEVENPKTINYKSGRPEPGGLFCERLFGPEKDWSCYCGKYQRARTAGFTCEACGVEVAHSSLRRQRMGHIELVTPVAHPWFARGVPNIMARLLGISPRKLERVLTYSSSIVTSLDEERRGHALARIDGTSRQDAAIFTALQALGVGTVLEDLQLADALRLLGGDAFRAGRGATAVRDCLGALQLDALSGELRQAIREGGLGLKRAIKRLHIVEAFRASGSDPCWMIFPVLPVLPPALRPLVELKDGRLATNDLNAFYERIICRNERIKHFLALEAPEVILNNEKRLLQDACDALFDNARLRTPMMGTRNKPLKSLTDVISGKWGRFRKNLLGKRVDYSARSVIVGDPQLLLHQCGLPTNMCLELFKPFLIRRLVDRHFAGSPHAAKRMVERNRHLTPVIWDVLEEVMYEKAVLLNRAPTLHRLSIQAFEAVRVEGSAIRLHPLVCSAFNADFDGDQMAVHLPLSDEAQAEAWGLLLSTHNLRSPASGEPSISLGQDIALGIFYLTQVPPSLKSAGRIFTGAAEALLAAEHGVIDLHTRILVRLDDPHIYDAPGHQGQQQTTPAGRTVSRRVETTLGRLLFNEALPKDLRFRNYTMTKERVKQIIADSLRVCGPQETADLADTLKTLGFHYATLSGTSFAISDIETLPQKRAMLEQAHAQAREIEELYRTGMIEGLERERQLVELWTNTTELISTRLEVGLRPFGTLATIINSGATKAKFQQIRQLSGMRGLLAGPGGRIIPIPILGNYLEGLQIWEAFLAASGARDGFMARSLNTAITGFLTRKLVEVGQEVWITEEDCEGAEAITITNEESQALLGLLDMGSRIAGRVLVERAGTLPSGTLLDETLAERIVTAGVPSVRVRSPLTCRAHYGICRACYGRDLATGQLVEKGLAVGVIAGQSIGEPGTQLSMRVFHTGGIAGAQGDIRAGLPRVIELFEARAPRDRAELSKTAGRVEIEKDQDAGTCTVRVVSTRAFSDCAEVCEIRAHTIPAYRALTVEQGQWIVAGMPLTRGTIDPGELLLTLGREATARHLVCEVQQVFRGTGVYINDRHVEIIVRQMLRYVLVTDPADTTAAPGEIIDRFALEALNARTLAEGGNPAMARPVLLGLTKAAMQTRSWVAAASFQDTSRVLTWAAVGGQTDTLHGLKARVIVGKQIPRREQGQ